MNKTLVILFLTALATGLFAQQSNKVKSKDRYREKIPLSQQEINEAREQYGALRVLAEQQLRPTTFALSQAMLQERLSTPASGRCMAYALLAGYETTARYQSRVSSLHGVLRGMPILYSYTSADSVFYPFAALYAILETGRQFMPNSYIAAQHQISLEQTFRQNGLPETLIAPSKKAATDIARQILDYARTDGYAHLSGYPPYQVQNQPNAWAPAPGTPALEPYWAYLRPFFLESAQQFANPSTVPYDATPGSPFRTYTEEVYQTSRTMVPEQYAVAYFWACDPAAAVQPGISRLPPTGRWINIAGIVCEQQKLAFIPALKAHTILAMAMADAVIATWEDKYRTLRVRPQTAVNQLLDAGWQPVLAAPATPAGLSLQGAVSATAAEILSRLIGENVSLADNSEAVFGVPMRQYPTIRHAAEEAAWSRLFAGLQFRDGILMGQQTGKNIGQLALRKWPVGM